jgi:integrase
MGKGSKERVLPISPTTAKAVRRYLSTYRKEDPVDEPLLIALGRRPMGRVALLQLLNSLGEKAHVPNCHPHRFRHTFAFNFLPHRGASHRIGGNAYELQTACPAVSGMALGHSTLEMVKTYLALADADLDAAHRKASPVEHWRL